MKGKISLDQVTALEANDKSKGKQFSFALHTKLRSYYFSCDSQVKLYSFPNKTSFLMLFKKKKGRS